MKTQLDEQGYWIINDVFTPSEVALMTTMIERINTLGDAFRKTKDLFAIRRFLQEAPQIAPLLFTDKCKEIISG